MNANELADKLDGFLKEQEQLPWGTKQVYLDQAATMLRQKQEDKELWQDQYLRLNEITEQWKNKCFKQQAEIKALKAEIVAIEKNTDYWADKSAKTLTDEEIIEITIRWFGSSRNDFFPEQWLDYARAILRKAQE